MSARDAAMPELEQAMTRLRDALYTRGGAAPTEEQLLELWWAADAATSIWAHGVCGNCSKPLCAHFGIGGRQCVTGSTLVVFDDFDSDDSRVVEEVPFIPGGPGWFTPREVTG